MSGSNFEDRLADGLDELAGDDGVALLRKQSWSTRRGSFQMSQEADVLVDSRLDKLYSAFEAKSRNYGKVRPNGVTGMYFSKDYQPDQIEKQMKYRDKSGRRFFVAMELIDFRGADSACFLLPVEVFKKNDDLGRSKVTWEQIAYLGQYIGSTSDVEITFDAMDAAEELGKVYADNHEVLDEWVEDTDDGESLPTDETPPVDQFF